MGHDDTPEGSRPKAELPPDVDEYVESLGGPDLKPPPAPKRAAGDAPAAPQDATSPTVDPPVHEITGEPADAAPAGSGGAHLARWAAIAAGAVVAIVIGISLALGGGNDGDGKATAGGKSTPAQAGSYSGNGAQPGSGGFLASAGLPTDLAYTATDVANGQSFRSTIRVSSSCSGKTCAYTSAFSPGAGMVRGTIPTVTWSHDGANWHVVLSAPILSSSTDGADCVYTYTDTWDLTVLGAEQGGGMLRAVQLRGTLSRNQRMDPSLSRGVGTTCLAYDSTQMYNVAATPA